MLCDGLLLGVGAKLCEVEVVTLVLTGVADPVLGLLLVTAAAFVLDVPPLVCGAAVPALEDCFSSAQI